MSCSERESMKDATQFISERVNARAGAFPSEEIPLRPARPHDALTLTALGVAVLIPFVYYGIQVLCAAYNPGYSFIRQVASELGSNRAARPMLFNVGIMVQGVVTLIASLGFLRATLRLGVNPTLSLLIFVALATNGIQMLWAGYFPLPDPRHAGQLPFKVAMFLLPILLTAALWKASGPILKGYLLATLILLAAMTAMTSSNIGVDTTHVRGLTQRLYTLAVFPVIAVSGVVLGLRYRGRRGA
jgi:hypothetical membrane protein